MKINANFNERIIVHAKGNQWLPTPINGAERMRLDRVGNKVARTTTPRGLSYAIRLAHAICLGQ